jgi:hypothetical protein
MNPINLPPELEARIERIIALGLEFRRLDEITSDESFGRPLPRLKCYHAGLVMLVVFFLIQ